MRALARWIVLVLAIAAAVPAIAQRFETGATAVVVDVVVRDRGGRQITDLTLADFELTEDGVPQRLTSIELVGTPTSTDAAPPAASGGTSTANPATTSTGTPAQPRYTALVFDRLDAESMVIARSGGEQAIAGAGPADVVAVFVVDGGLRMLQGFTADRGALTKAVGVAVQRAAQLVTRNAQGERSDGGGSPSGIASAESGAGEIVAGRPAEMASIAVPRVARNTWEMLERQFNGHSSTDGVMTATAALAALPGRKTLLYFTDGIAVPDDVLPRIQDVVAAANRGQVTIYGIDTGGLRVGSQNAATATEVKQMGNAGLAVNPDGSSNSNLAMMEKNEEVLRRAPRVGLTLLSKPTGGFLIQDTNDLAAGVRRIDADRRIHYLISYTPTRADLDGKWRAIAVKVKRRGVTVQSRDGYVAVRSPGTLPVLVFEGPALAAVDRTPPPRDIPVAVGAFSFPRETPPTGADPATDDLAVVISTPAAPLTFETKGSDYRTDFTMLALVRDTSGQALHKTSAPYRLTGRAGDRDRVRGNEIRFVRSLPLTPGTYRVAGAVYDVPSGRTGVVTVPARGYGRGESGLGISSLVLLERIERRPAASAAPDAAARRDPFTVGDRVITPYVPSPERPMRRTADARLGFYLTAVGAKPGERLQGQVRVTRMGVAAQSPIVDAPVTLDPADDRGRVICLGQLPLQDFPDGELELRVILSRSEGARDVRSATFHLAAPAPQAAAPPR